jgi:hypothetical protein
MKNLSNFDHLHGLPDRHHQYDKYQNKNLLQKNHDNVLASKYVLELFSKVVNQKIMISNIERLHAFKNNYHIS